MKGIKKGGILASVTFSDVLKMVVLVATMGAFGFRMEGRLDMVEYRIHQLEVVESRDFAELKEQVGGLVESLTDCQTALARLESDMAHVRSLVDGGGVQ